MKSLACALLAAAFSLSLLAADDTPERIVRRELQSSQAYDTLSHLTDEIGPRPSGSAGAAAAVHWTTERLRAWGLDTRNERVVVPHWVRGREEGRLVSHPGQRLVLTALGGSVATPASGLTADLVEVTSFEQLQRLGKTLAGKIVFYNNEMDMRLVRSHRAFEAYRLAVIFRASGASRAAEYGAKAVVIRSVGSASLRTPHTGAMHYDPKQPKIPAAALTAEDAMLLHRLLERGDRVRMHLLLTPRTLPDAVSANVIAEWKGREKAEEIVLIGAHLDSWDLGTGAIDDGSGVAMVMETMRLLAEMNVHPRRTIRAVLFMNEENGLAGGRAYFAAHGKEKHVAAIESDAGAAAPIGFTTTLKGDALSVLEAQAFSSLTELHAAKFETVTETGADTRFLTEAGVAGFGLVPDPLHYFDYHHTPADTLDKVDRQELAQDSAAIAALAWLLAER